MVIGGGSVDAAHFTIDIRMRNKQKRFVIQNYARVTSLVRIFENMP